MRWVVSLLLSAALCHAQNRPVANPAYILAPKDHILIRASQMDKLNGRIFVVERTGLITIPGIGRLRAAGQTVESLEKQLAGRLRPDASGQRMALISVVNCSPSRPNCLSPLSRK
jgi:protein involved in polysaccharide export with SLBB domain